MRKFKDWRGFGSAEPSESLVVVWSFAKGVNLVFILLAALNLLLHKGVLVLFALFLRRVGFYSRVHIHVELVADHPRKVITAISGEEGAWTLTLEA